MREGFWFRTLNVLNLKYERLVHNGKANLVCCCRKETALRTVSRAGESWPVDSLAVWATGSDGPQVELQIDMIPEGQQMVAA